MGGASGRTDAGQLLASPGRVCRCCDGLHHSRRWGQCRPRSVVRLSATEASRTFAFVSQGFSGVVIMTTIEDVLSRLRAEFVEMPGMLLTPDQVQRLCGVERALCGLAPDA